MAAASDARLARGEARALEGIPLAIKDLFCTEGTLTTAGSRILDGFRPPYESTVTRKLWEAGATMLGKANLDEFAMGSSNMTSAYGGVKNPWRRKDSNADLVPGGSSGGSAAFAVTRAASPPSSTASARCGSSVSTTDAIGSTPAVSTASSCSTQARMVRSSAAIFSSSESGTLIRASVATFATVALSSAMG